MSRELQRERRLVPRSWGLVAANLGSPVAQRRGAFFLVPRAMMVNLARARFPQWFRFHFAFQSPSGFEPQGPKATASESIKTLAVKAKRWGEKTYARLIKKMVG